MMSRIRTALMVVICLSLMSLAFAGDPSGMGAGCMGKGGCSGKGSCMSAGKHGATEAKTSDKVVPYVLDKCIVSGEKLGGMGDPVVKVYDGREVKFCCNGCVAKFEKDKATYMQKIDDAIIAQQKPTYPLTTCVVSGEKLDGGQMQAVDYLYNNQLVRFCCNGCISKFEKDPEKYLSMLHPQKAMDKSTEKSEAKPDAKAKTD
jgi:YHS domain-containing protein